MSTKILIIDTETGGLDPAEYSLLSLGAVVWDNGKAGNEIAIAIAEDNIVTEPEAMSINRIDLAAHKASAMHAREAITAFVSFLQREFPTLSAGERITLCGHNVGFDVGFIKRLFRLTGLHYDDYFSHRTLDTASIVRFLILAGMLPLERAKSEMAFEFFGVNIAPTERHTALADARATARLLTAMLAFVKIPTR